MGIMMIAGTEHRRQGCSLQDGKQWGINTGGAVRTSTLPIPFTNVFLAVASTSSEWCCPGCSATNTTVTTRAYQSNRPDVAQPNDVNWIIIGCQPQWGTNTIGSRTTRTEAYPLPYSEFCLPIVSGKGYVGGLNYGFGVGVTNFGLTSVTIANNSEDSGYRWTGYTYIIVGAQQQWGVGAASTNIMLPIPYTKVKFITLATSSMLNPSQGNISVAYHDSTLDSVRFQIRWQGLAAEYTGAWLTLGI